MAPAVSTSVVGGLFQVLSSEHAPRRNVWTHMLREDLRIGRGAAAAQHAVSGTSVELLMRSTAADK